jgi:hypothetical protein
MWALVCVFSSTQEELWLDVLTVRFLMYGTRMSGWVFRQNDIMDTQMKNTDIMPMICNEE